MSYNHHPSDSLSNAAYPSDSSYTPGQSQNHHPSDSLANAAYPQDSSYRPSAPTSHPDDKLAMPEARYSQSFNTAAIGAGSRQAPTAPYPQYPSNAAQSPAWVPSPTHDPLMGPYSPARGPGVQPWSPDGMSAANPNLPPPPPYDPARPGTGATGTSTPREPNSPHPSETALLGQHQQQQQQQQQQQPQIHQNAAMPAQPQSPYTPQQQTPVPAAAHIAEPPTQNGEQPRAYLQSMTGGMPAYGNNPGGLGPVAKERKRKKQKLAILAAVLCAVLLFLIALIVGVLVGVVKVGRDEKPPPPGPPGF